MNNAGSVLIHRIAGQCLSHTRCARAVQFLRPVTSPFLAHRGHRAASNALSFAALDAPHSKEVAQKCSFFSTSARAAFQQGFISRQDQPIRREDEDKGLAFQKGDLEGEELHDVYGAVTPPPRIANRFLRVLHARRNDGTLDLALPPSLQELMQRYPYAMNSALHWLRQTHPLDEDAAIMARIQREESDEDYSPSELQQRAQDLRLYETAESEYSGPQSGHYQAQLSEKEGDLFGQSEVDRIRTENIAEAEQEEADLQAMIDEKMATYTRLQEDKQQALAERPEQGIEVSEGVRPPNSFERWILQKKQEAQSNFTLESPAIAEMSLLQRILPSAIFVALVCAGSYLFAQYWVPPKRSDRMYPDVALSFATIGALIAANVVVFGLWGLPIFWRTLNRYFVATPAHPRAVSMLCNIFSHQETKHLLTNMLGILLFGLSLHEDVGRGVFMGIYIASGAVGSLASLTFFAVRRHLVSSSLGASGSLWGVMSAYCWLHADEKFSPVFLPSDLQDKLQLSGWMLLSGLVAYEVFGLFGPIKVVDRASHLGGMAVGVVCAQVYKKNEQKSGEVKERKRRIPWYDIVMGKQGGEK